ncbi:MAG: FtsX-like permease family protein [Clostridiales bacterium]|nr:FtsX-like permease family protein [Clostridiales bacterium]
MSKKALNTDLFREIKNTKSRFFSILILVVIAVCFLFGLRMAAPDMKASMDAYLDAQELMDVHIMSTLGLTQEDVDAVAETEGTLLAEGAYAVDALASGGVETMTVKVLSLSENGVNEPYVTEGRLPQAADECLVEENVLSTMGLEIGDTISLDTGTGSYEDTLGVTSFTIVGTGTSPLYVSMSRGTSTLGNGSVSAIIELTEDAFDMDYFTDIYIRTQGTAELNTYEDEYEALVEEYTQRLELIRSDREQARTDEVKGEAQEEIDDAWAEYYDAEEEAQQELDDAAAELDDAAQELADGWQEYEDGLADLADARQEIADGKAELADAYTTLKEGEADYADGLAEYRDGEDAYAEGLAEYQDGEDAYADGLEQYQAGKATYEESLAEYEAGEAAYAEGLAEYEAGETAYADGLAQYEAGEAAYADGLAQYEAGETAYADGLAQYEAGETAYTDGLAQYEAGETAYADGLAQYEAGLAEYEAGLEQYQAGVAQYEAAAAALEQQRQSLIDSGLSDEEADALLAEAQAELESTWAVLESTRATLEESKAALDETKATLEASRTQLDETKATLEASRTQLDETKATLEASRTQLDETKATLEASRAQLDETKTTLEASRTQLDEAKATLEATRSQLDDAKSQLDAAARELADSWAILESSRAELDAAKATLKSSRSQLDEAKSELADARQELDEGWAEYYDGLDEIADAEQEVSDGESELADAYVELTDGESEYADGLQEYEDAKAEADQELADARQEIEDAQAEGDDIDTAEWYILDRTDNTGFASYEQDAERMGKLATLFPTVFFLVAALVCLTTMTRMVDEQRVQIGGLKALGYSNGDIARKYVGYGLIASLAGSAIGLILGGIGIPWVIVSCWKIMYDYPGVVLTFSWPTALGCAGAAVGCCTLAVLASALTALRATPASLMRPKAPQAGKRVWLEHIPFIWKRLSFSYKVTVRNLFRYKKRLCMTVIGIAGCTGLIITGFGLRDSIMDILSLQYDNVSPYSAILYLGSDLTEDEEQELADTLAGEEELEGYTYVYLNTATLESDTYSLSGNILAVEDPADLEGFWDFHDRLTQEPVEMQSDGALVSEKTADLLGLEVGDAITVVNGDDRGTVTITGIVENYVQHYVYLTKDAYEVAFGQRLEDAEVLLTYGDEADWEGMGSRLLELDSVAGIYYMSDARETVANQLNGVYPAVIIIICGAAVLAFVVLYNLSSINITERQRELATLRVLGFRDKEMRDYVFRENIILTLIGIAFGLVLGKAFHSYLITTVEVEMVMFGRTAQPMSYVLSVAMTLLFALLVNWVAGRRLAKIDMVESLKTVE